LALSNSSNSFPKRPPVNAPHFLLRALLCVSAAFLPAARDSLQTLVQRCGADWFSQRYPSIPRRGIFARYPFIACAVSALRQTRCRRRPPSFESRWSPSKTRPSRPWTSMKTRFNFLLRPTSRASRAMATTQHGVAPFFQRRALATRCVLDCFLRKQPRNEREGSRGMA